jgi:murein DD-endopeptidase MepM/ murein hydrolase activator NlpD
MLEFTVFGAVVMCGSGSRTTIFTPPYRGVSIGNGWPGTEYDTSSEDFRGNFGYCRIIDATCVMSLYDRWFKPSEGVMYRPGLNPLRAIPTLDFALTPNEPSPEALLTMSSALVCSKGDKLTFVTDGQHVGYTKDLNPLDYQIAKRTRQAGATPNLHGNMRVLPYYIKPPYRPPRDAAAYISPYGEEIVVPITSPYGYRINTRTGIAQFHAAWDFAYGLNRNAPIYSIAPGEVVAVRDGSVSGKGYGFGTHVIIQHYDLEKGPFQALYAHLKYGSADHFVSGWEKGEGKIVEENRKIKRGDKIGEQGNTTVGKVASDAYHLHFQTWDGITIDYDVSATFNPLEELFKIEMTREGINDKSNLFILSEDVKNDYSWTVAFQNKFGRKHPTFNDEDILDLMDELIKIKNKPLEGTNN